MKLIKLFKKKTKSYKRGVKSFRWHHPFVIPTIVFFVLFFGSIIAFIAFSGETIGASDTKVVKLSIDGAERTIPTRAHRVKDLLAKLDIELKREDAVKPPLETPITKADFRVEIIHAKPYVIVDADGNKTYGTLAGVDEKDVVNKAGVDIYFEDRVSAEPTFADETLRDGFVGTKLVIDRATPVVVNLYGKNIILRTHEGTVGALLREKGIVLRKKDRIKPSLDTKLKPNLGVFIFTKGKKIVSKEERIDPPIREIEDPEAPLGEETVIDAGEPGVRVVTYQLILKNGQEVGRKEIQSVTTKQPRERVVVVGTKFAGFEGGFEAALAALRSCEGSYTSNTGNGYYGAYQFSFSSWQGYAPARYKNTLPSNTPPAVQDLAAANYYRASGWSPWPACSRNLGLQDIYR